MRRLAIALLATAMTAGCASDPTAGYASTSLWPSRYRSVAVPIFENDTMTRQMEFMLTEAIVREIQARTPYRIAPEASADTLLRGRIRKVTLQGLSQSRTTGLTQEMLVKVVIDFEWSDQASGRRIMARENFAADGLFVPSRPASEPLDVGQFAVVQQLADDIVDEMQAAW